MKWIENAQGCDIYQIDICINDTVYLATPIDNDDFYFVYPKNDGAKWYGFIKTSSEVKIRYNAKLKQIDREEKLKRILE